MESEKIKLSKSQQKAVETVEKNICVSAGAGSGKTGVLVERFIYLVKERGISPSRILAITFTEKAANEMKRRIVRRLEEEKLEDARREVENAAIGTIHSFSARILREHPIEAGIDPHFVIFEAEEAAGLKERILDEVIETQASDAEVFNLLCIYGEKSLREGILDVYHRSRNSETPFEEMMKRRAPATHEFFEKELKKGLEKISEVNGAEEVRKELDLILKQKDLDKDINRVAALKSKLRAAGKQKDEIRRVQETLLDFCSFLREEKSLPLRDVFIRLALQFEKKYEETKRTERALDFDDLQLYAVRLLGSDREASRSVRKIYQEKFFEIMVDEFQDTNRLQDRLLELIRRKNNLFVVGDLKQSIYGFRGTQIEIFLEKEKAFSQSPDGLRLALNENYRARPPLIDFINRFFETLWKEDGVPFEPLQAVRGEGDEKPRIERLRLEKKKEETADDLRIREARSIAQHIHTLAKEGVAYQDIACLFEAMSDIHFYEQAFRQADIPYFVVSNRGFYFQPEIRDCLSFLSALENPKRDVPLAAVLRSPFFQISDDTLFWLARQAKAEKPPKPLAEGLKEFELLREIPEPEKEKLRFFKKTFEFFLAQKEKLRISELIEKVLHVTGYDLYVLKWKRGNRAFANLKKLVEIAREMESKEALHLGDFVRALKGLEMREVRESQAQVEAEAGKVVRLMTIHMAKGLEFPVVFLPDLGRGDKSQGGNFLISEEDGLGIKIRNEETFKAEETLTFTRNKKRTKRIGSEESKRLLYVAMTRAKDRLILTGPAPDKELKDSFHEMATWADWVERVLSEGDWKVTSIPEALPDPFPFERQKAWAERKPLRGRFESLSPVPLRETPEGIDTLLQNLRLPEKVEFQRIDLPVSAFLLFAKDPEAYFTTYEMGAPESGRIKSVEIKEEEPVQEDGLSSAEIGTRVHQILEQALVRGTPTAGIETLAAQLNQDLDSKQTAEMAEMVNRFLQSPEAQGILKTRIFYPELPFVLRLPYGLIQGTLDLLYQNPKGEWVILDYKTSKIDPEKLVVRGEEYRIQLELYALAVSKILGVVPKEGSVHFLRAGLIHRIPFLAADTDRWFEKFASLQKEILKFRREKVALV